MIQKSEIRNGFTLIEMLVIISIIALLIAILVPSINIAYRESSLAASKASVNMINSAVEMFKHDFGELPPSTGGGGELSLPAGWKGAELLCLLLTGYGPDAGNAGTPFEGTNTFNQDDGKTGFGFRTQQRGKVYGPYNGVENIAIGNGPNGKVFIDNFNNPILYYRYDDASSEYDKDHNSGPDQPYLDDATTTVRKDFILLSLGADTSWGNKLSNKQVSNFGKN